QDVRSHRCSFDIFVIIRLTGRKAGSPCPPHPAPVMHDQWADTTARLSCPRVLWRHARGGPARLTAASRLDTLTPGGDDMARYLLGRILSLMISITAVSVIVFTLMHSVPGGPFTYEKQMPEAAMQNILRKYGLDRPVYEQYFNWIGAMLHG